MEVGPPGVGVLVLVGVGGLGVGVLVLVGVGGIGVGQVAETKQFTDPFQLFLPSQREQ